MNSSMKSDQNLLADLTNLVSKEKLLIVQVLEHLREVETRKLHLARGFASMFAFCTEGLGYSEPEAQIRIQAMRLTKDVPAVAEQIANGHMSLSVAAMVQSAFRIANSQREDLGVAPLSTLEKKQIVLKLQTCSKREAEVKLAEALNSGPVKTKFYFEADEDLVKDLEELKGLLAHKNFSGDLSGLIRIMAKNMLSQIRRDKPKTENNQEADNVQNFAAKNTAGGDALILRQTVWKCDTDSVAKNAAPIISKPSKMPSSRSSPALRSRYVSVKIKREVWKKSRGRCQFIDLLSGRKCESQHGLEIDHIHEFSRGGHTTIDNLRLLCSGHNKFRNDHTMQNSRDRDPLRFVYKNHSHKAVPDPG